MRIAAWVMGLVAIATIAAIAQGGQGNDLSKLPRPSRAFCSAAAKYDDATTSRSLPLHRHVELTKAIATSAPADTRSDAILVWRSYVKLAAGDRNVVDNPRVKAALDHVNRRATQTCGWFQRDSGI
jgi:hypothetical protein